jgi:ABC-type lipoprotein release transport system permease subunit
MVIGLLSWALSILFSIPITSVLTYGVGVSTLGSPLPPVIDTRGMIVWLVFSLMLTFISSAIPSRSASLLTIKDILAYEG